MRYPWAVTLRLTLPVLLLSVGLLGCNSPSTPAPTPTKPAVTPPPATTRALPPADPREAELARSIANVLSTEHLVQTEIDDSLSQQAFSVFLDRIDPGKAFLLSNHVAELRNYERNMDDELRSGDLVLARLAEALRSERQTVVAKVAKELLAAPFDYTVDETFEVDAEKRKFLDTEEELRDYWRKTLKLQTLERIERMSSLNKSLTESLAKAKTAEEKTGLTKALAKIPKTDAARHEKARTDIAKSYAARFSRLQKSEPLESAEKFLNAVASVYDPHTVYLAPAEQANFDIRMSGSLEGIGAVLREDDHYIKVEEVVPGGASARQGQLKAGDLILSVAQADRDPIDIADMRINQVVEMIRGPKDTVVTLTVKKSDDRVESISITRDVVEIEDSYARGGIIDPGKGRAKIGLVYLPSFYGNTRSRPGQTPQRNATDDVRAILRSLTKQQIGAVILDLRSNGGGLLDQARDISGMFFETGPVVQTRYSGGETEVLVDRDKSVDFSGHLIVLVDRFSASASEIVAAALQDYGRAVVVGTATHGKGTVQVLIDLTRLAKSRDKPHGMLKLTIQQFFRVNGGSTQWRGVIPDVALPDSAAHIESGERFLDHAIKWSEVKAVDYPKNGVDKLAKRIPQLVTKSAARVATSAVFGKVTKLSSLAKARRKRTVVSLKRVTWKAEREADEKALEAADPKIDEQKDVFKVTVVKSGLGKGGVKNDRIERWRKGVARDPWVAESVRILEDMARTP